MVIKHKVFHGEIEKPSMVPQGGEGQPPAKKKKFNRSPKACTYCRQKKLKCDALTRFPKGCTQCERNSLYCEIDADYKQAQRSENATTTQVHSPHHKDYDKERSTTPPLSELVGSGSGSIGSEVSTRTTPNEPITPLPVQHDLPDNSRRVRYKFLYDESPLEDLVEGDLVIPGNEVRAMFRMFYAKFYHHLPIFFRDHLDPNLLTGPRYIVKLAILTVVSSVEYPQYTQKLTMITRHRLKTAEVTLVSITFVMNPDTGIAFIMAALLLITWVPPLYRRQLDGPKEDQSWILSGMATYLGLQMGMHRAHLHDEYRQTSSSFETSDERQNKITSLCWAGLFIATQSQCCSTGLPNLAPLNNSIFDHIAPLKHRIPEMRRFEAELRIMHAIRNGIDKLGNCPDTEMGMVDPQSRALVHSAVVSSFSQIVSAIGYHDRYTEMLFLLGKLQFHSFLLAPDTPKVDQKAIALPLYLVCVKMLHLSIDLVRTEESIRMIPTTYVRLPIMAVVMLFGLTISELEPLLDVDACKAIISEVYQMFKNLKTSWEGPRRAAMLIDALYELHARGEFKQPIFELRSRMGAGGFICLLVKTKRYMLQKADQLRLKEGNDKAAAAEDAPVLPPLCPPTADDPSNQPAAQPSHAQTQQTQAQAPDVQPEGYDPLGPSTVFEGLEYILTDIWDWDNSCGGFSL